MTIPPVTRLLLPHPKVVPSVALVRILLDTVPPDTIVLEQFILTPMELANGTEKRD